MNSIQLITKPATRLSNLVDEFDRFTPDIVNQFSGWRCLLKHYCDHFVTIFRLFSVAGNLVTDERNRLLPETAEKLLFCRENLPLVNFQY